MCDPPKDSSDYLQLGSNVCDLPRDLTEEILSMLPVTSLRGTRFTCKKLNTITRDQSFAKKHIARTTKKKQLKESEFQVVMVVEYRVSLMSVNLLTPSIERIGKLISLADADRVDVSKIFHCKGLLLCVLTKDTNSRLQDTNSRLVVWNPYSGQTRWIEPRISYHRLDTYALGYDKSRRIHKILRFVDNYDPKVKRRICEFEIYSFESNSWKVLDVTPDWFIRWSYPHGVSLHGKTYWYAQEKPPLQGPDLSDLPDFLLCFDFTTERFGPRLRLPFHAFFATVTLSSVRDNQLAILCQKRRRPELKIWITNKIEPNAVSWRKFIAVDMIPLTCTKFTVSGASFFVDEKKKVAVILDKDIKTNCPLRNVAKIIGKKGYFKQVDLGESIDSCRFPLVCSYTPSSVQI